jgi:aspartate aminotransferase
MTTGRKDAVKNEITATEPAEAGCGCDQLPGVNLNLRIRGLSTSATLAVNELSAQLIEEGREIFKFGLGQSPFPVPEPVVRALQENAYQKDYLPVRGLHRLREAVADYHHRKDGIRRSAQNVLIGPGSKELMFLIQITYYGDLVIPTPSWVSYSPQAEIIGRQVRWLPTDSENNWLVLPQEVDYLCKADPDRPRLLILNYPNNPTGHSYKPELLKLIAEVACKYKMVVLSDEIYGEIHHDGQHTSIAEYYPQGTIISTGLSKWCGAGGWRLGCFTFPDSLQWLLDAMAVVASETYTATSAPIQYAAVRAFQGGPEIETYLVQCRRILKALATYCVREMSRAGIKVQQPQGAFYLFPSFSPFREGLEERGIFTNKQLAEHILKDTGVAALPGSDFGRPESRLTMRMAYVDFDGEKALAALDHMPPDAPLTDAFLRSYCSNVVEGVDRLCQWVGNLES